MTNEEIKKWISENLIVDRFPLKKDFGETGKHKDINAVINVSDQFYLGNCEDIVKFGKLNFYFPMGEESQTMGLNSIYGAMQVLHNIFTFNPEWKILIHCQAGKNRSPTIKSAFYYMMLSEHEPNQFDDKNVLVRNNRLIDNCERGKLPTLDKMELFLSKCKEAFDKPEKFYGGMFEWICEQSNIFSTT